MTDDSSVMGLLYVLAVFLITLLVMNEMGL